MKLTNRAEYALLAMLTLTRIYIHRQKKYITIHRIAQKNSIPKKFLEKIFADLSRAGYVETQQGPKGGVRLAKHPKKISIAKILREIDGPLAPVSSVSKLKYAPSPIERSKTLTFIFKRIRDIEHKILSSTTFADLVT